MATQEEEADTTSPETTQSGTEEVCSEINNINIDRSGQTKDRYIRTLTAEEKQDLERDTKLVSEFKRNKFEKEAQKNWDKFYLRNGTRFFKDRHWTTREFHELCGNQFSDGKFTLLEVGCGVGNFIFPILEENKNVYAYVCDFSPRAVQFVKDNPLYEEGRCKAFQCDITSMPLQEETGPSNVDIVTMIFVLSAIHPDKMVQALTNIFQVLRPGGMVLFRDYGLYDHAMLRFTPGHKLDEHFYVRQDGTRAFYFSEEKLSDLFESAGFEVVRNEYIGRQTVNCKEGLCVPRVFLQAKFRKPDSQNTCQSQQRDNVEHGDNDNTQAVTADAASS